MKLRLLQVADLDDDELQTVDEARCWKDDVLELDLPRSSSIADVQSEIHTRMNLPASHLVRVFFRGRELAPDWHVCASRLSANECLVFTSSAHARPVSPSASSRSASPDAASLGLAQQPEQQQTGDMAHQQADARPALRLCGLESMSQLSDNAQRIVQHMLVEARRGLACGKRPELSEDGSGGTYFLRNPAGRTVACFKPRDEEPAALNNPRGHGSELREGVRAGEAVQRELAAFITDDGGFSGVPHTVLVEAQHAAFHYRDGAVRPKVGSLQRFVAADATASDFSPALFPVDEVHKIAVLDIRLMNADRNDGNLLVSRRPKPPFGARRVLSRDDADTGDDAADLLLSGLGALGLPSEDDDDDADDETQPLRARVPLPPASFDATLRKPRAMSCSPPPTAFHYALIPVDHGLCLPDQPEVAWFDWCWLDWPQMRQPASAATRRFVDAYDPDAAAARLRRELNIREPCLRVMRAAGRLLKRGVAAGLTLHDVASIAARQQEGAPSVLEAQMARAEELARAMLGNARIRGGHERPGNKKVDAAVAGARKPRPPRLEVRVDDDDDADLDEEEEDEVAPCEAKQGSSRGIARATLSSVDLASLGAGDEASGSSRRPAALLVRGSVWASADGRSGHGAENSDAGNSALWSGAGKPPPLDSPRRRGQGGSVGANDPANVALQPHRQRMPTAGSLCLLRRRSSAASPHRHRSANAAQLSAGAAAAVQHVRALASCNSTPPAGEGEEAQQQREGDETGDGGSAALEQLFFAYLERLLDDVIACVQRRGPHDARLFRSSNSVLHLTSPHRLSQRVLPLRKWPAQQPASVPLPLPTQMLRGGSCGDEAHARHRFAGDASTDDDEPGLERDGLESEVKNS